MSSVALASMPVTSSPPYSSPRRAPFGHRLFRLLVPFNGARWSGRRVARMRVRPPDRCAPPAQAGFSAGIDPRLAACMPSQTCPGA